MKAHHLALSSLITLSFFLAILPPSYCTDDARFVDCSHPYECGRIINVSYPFWGVNRPEYCGRQGFKLECYDDEYPIIKFEELEFLILNINESQNNMTIARLDLWHGFCPQTYLDTVLNYNIFDYAPTVLNITLFYDCPLAVSTLIPVQNKFKCSLEAFAATESALITAQDPPGTLDCRTHHEELRLRVPMVDDCVLVIVRMEEVMSRHHPYMVWHRRITRLYIDRTSAKMEILLTTQLAVLNWFNKESYKYKFIKKALEDVDEVDHINVPANDEAAN
nr:leaf rust 10 disease-resistance locus receptor-like protein kinase-like 1.4 [Quercus suber]